MTTYVALIHKDADSDYGVSFPDLPGCVSAGSSVDEAIANAKEALSLHIEGMLEDGEEIPAPTDAAAIDRENSLLIAAIDVPDNLKVERVNITVPAITLVRIDSFAQQRGMNRSALLVEGFQRWIADEHAALNRPQRPRALASAAAVPDLFAELDLAPPDLSARRDLRDHLVDLAQRVAQRANYSKEVVDKAALSAIQEALSQESPPRKDEAEKFETRLFELAKGLLDEARKRTAPTEQEEDLLDLVEKTGGAALQTSDDIIDNTIKGVTDLLERYRYDLKQYAKKHTAKKRVG